RPATTPRTPPALPAARAPRRPAPTTATPPRTARGDTRGASPPRSTARGRLAFPPTARPGGCSSSRSGRHRRAPAASPRRPCVPSLYPRDRPLHARDVDRIDLDPPSDVVQQGDGEIAAQVLAKLLQAPQHGTPALAVDDVEGGVPDRQPQPLQQRDHPLERILPEPPLQRRVASIHRDPDRHRLAVPQRVLAERLQLVRRPVTEVQRARAAGLERIAAGRD